MQLTLAALALTAFVHAQAAAPTINTPTQLSTCEPSLLTWTGTGPFYLTVLPGGMSAATPLETLLTASAANSYTWSVFFHRLGLC